ncbi:MAG: hypothetical protein MJ179_04650 [Treponema sp.]|nr:hypothetical protein [Treponema sp.]
MNKIKISLIIGFILIILSLCICCPLFGGKTEEPEPEPVPEVVVTPEPEPIVEPEPEPEPVVEVIPEPVVIPEPEPEPEPVVEVIPEPEPSEDDEEYLRSINNLVEESVTKAEFTDDKSAILTIISDLSEIMETKDAKRWLVYIEPESVNYYSNITNLKKAQKKLPNKAISLNNITDYFNYVFIPSRKRSQVDEIRYISKSNIKAVQVKDDKSIVVYYYFTKIDGKWFIHLPPIS